MNDSALFTVIIIAAVVWVVLEIAEQIYNRCKKRALIAENKELLDALSKLCQAHEGWEHGLGCCVCEPHRNARKVIGEYHKRGRR